MRYYLFVFCALLLLVGFGSMSFREKKIKKDKVPASIRDYIEKEYPGAKRVKYYIESDEDTSLYEVECIYNKERISLTFLSDGTLYEIEKSIAFEALPASVQKTITSYLNQTYHRYKVTNVQFVNPHLKTEYELNVKVKRDSGPAFYEMYFDTTGNLIRAEELIIKPIPTLF